MLGTFEWSLSSDDADDISYYFLSPDEARGVLSFSARLTDSLVPVEKAHFYTL
jgi:hypothetical protein